MWSSLWSVSFLFWEEFESDRFFHVGFWFDKQDLSLVSSCTTNHMIHLFRRPTCWSNNGIDHEESDGKRWKICEGLQAVSGQKHSAPEHDEIYPRHSFRHTGEVIITLVSQRGRSHNLGGWTWVFKKNTNNIFIYFRFDFHGFQIFLVQKDIFPATWNI